MLAFRNFHQLPNCIFITFKGFCDPLNLLTPNKLTFKFYGPTVLHVGDANTYGTYFHKLHFFPKDTFTITFIIPTYIYARMN